jgi:hypothetical protein
MHDEAQKQQRSERISGAFADLAAKLEDAAALAAGGQKPQADGALAIVAQQIETLAEEVATIAGALAGLLEGTPSQEG